MPRREASVVFRPRAAPPAKAGAAFTTVDVDEAWDVARAREATPRNRSVAKTDREKRME